MTLLQITILESVTRFPSAVSSPKWVYVGWANSGRWRNCVKALRPGIPWQRWEPPPGWFRQVALDFLGVRHSHPARHLFRDVVSSYFEEDEMRRILFFVMFSRQACAGVWYQWCHLQTQAHTDCWRVCWTEMDGSKIRSKISMLCESKWTGRWLEQPGCEIPLLQIRVGVLCSRLTGTFLTLQPG